MTKKKQEQLKKPKDPELQEYQVNQEQTNKYLDGSHNPAATKKLIRNEANDWKKATQNNKKLSNHLAGIAKSKLKSIEKAQEHDNLLLLNQNQTNGNLLEPENKLEKTWKYKQADIKSSTNLHNSLKSFNLNLKDPNSGIGGPFKFDYNRNGNFLALIDQKVAKYSNIHLKSLNLIFEIGLLNEHLRAVKWLHNQSFMAIAQKRYVYIYDGHQGSELHQLRGHVEVTQMEFLPYHFLLTTVGLPGWLKYHDTSTGQIVAQHATKLGSCHTMTQNPFNSIINLGHQNGTVTLWSPSVNQPLVKFLAHLGPVTSLSVDPSSSGNLLTTTGLDGSLKIWDTRNWKTLTSWTLKKPAKTTAWSQKGLLAVGWGAHVSVYSDIGKSESKKGAYMNQLFPSQEVEQVQFCPFEDLLGVSHSSGFSQLIIPGSGEANFDSLEADPFETKTRKKEREVHNLLDKIPFELININPNFVGSVAPKAESTHQLFQSTSAIKDKNNQTIIVNDPNSNTPYRKLTRIQKLKLSGVDALEGDEEDDDQEEDNEGPEDSKKGTTPEKKKMRGKNSSLKRFLRRKKRQNVITPQTEALKAKLSQRKQLHIQQQKQKAAQKDGSGGGTGGGALSRFS
ncbi:Small subunit (SSU) processome component [Puccinia graminis f. sp. tritici]|nr:Small subunit (SSU) processome component [Puccinia graminis f. sp. tritici]KAA1129126.1 Small subunit (SSU) processome component [Puccinia graminis f. sp. tritici]